ncbi:mitochondrial amidoxime-reducing component 1-like [Pelobates fuscus]|uniref:mitochondrial amidoxime-reducing component 1-like n=1 Tax=Pelobates fuscus TaxID=191477 RepID=UPI002FE4F522
MSSYLTAAIQSALQAFPRQRLLLLWTAGVGLTAIATWMWWRKKQSEELELKQVGIVSELLIYPIKSCRPVSVQEADCMELGLYKGDLRDRHWLVVTEDGHMVTGRQEPRMVLISVSVRGDSLCLKGEGMDELLVPMSLPKSNKVRDCRVFGKDIQGRDCGEEASRWFTSYFQSSQPYHLVHFEEKTMRPRKSKDSEVLFRDVDVIAYSDASPIMLLSETSMEDLNSRLAEPISLRNFRPCIVVSDCNAFAEDAWHDIRVGTARLKRIMACGRCILTTVNPDTGIITRKEPLDTLRTYRKSDAALSHVYKTSPLFGQYYGVDQTGTLHVGDPIYQVIHKHQQ